VLQALTHTLSQLDVVLEDIEVLRTVPTPDKQNDIRVKFKVISNRDMFSNRFLKSSFLN
jgi:hypothetical protein